MMKMRKILTVLVPALTGYALLAAPHAPALAETRIQKTFEQWVVNCAETEAKKNCFMSFGLVNSKNKRLVLGWNIIRAREGEGLTAVIRTPLGTDLPKGISVKLGDGTPVTVPYKTCGTANCVGELAFSEEWQSALGAGTNMVVSYALANGKDMSHTIELKGFGDGLAYLNSQLK